MLTAEADLEEHGIDAHLIELCYGKTYKSGRRDLKKTAHAEIKDSRRPPIK